MSTPARTTGRCCPRSNRGRASHISGGADYVWLCWWSLFRRSQTKHGVRVRMDTRAPPGRRNPIPLWCARARPPARPHACTLARAQQPLSQQSWHRRRRHCDPHRECRIPGQGRVWRRPPCAWSYVSNGGAATRGSGDSSGFKSEKCRGPDAEQRRRAKQQREQAKRAVVADEGGKRGDK